MASELNRREAILQLVPGYGLVRSYLRDRRNEFSFLGELSQRGEPWSFGMYVFYHQFAIALTLVESYKGLENIF